VRRQIERERPTIARAAVSATTAMAKICLDADFLPDHRRELVEFMEAGSPDKSESECTKRDEKQAGVCP